MSDNDEEPFTVWSTKYALTAGIQTITDARLSKHASMHMIYFDDTKQFLHGKDWHRTLEAALVRAEEMRVSRIASLKASIAKLECMAFSAPAT